MDLRHADALKSGQLKATPKRLAILRLLSEASVYLGPQDIWERLRKEFVSLGLPTVYRNLEELVDAGLVTRIIHPNRQLYYYLCEKKAHHHHFICLECGRVEDIDFCAEKQLDLEVRHRHGGQVLSHVLQVNGLCQGCAGMKKTEES